MKVERNGGSGASHTLIARNSGMRDVSLAAPFSNESRHIMRRPSSLLPLIAAVSLSFTAACSSSDDSTGNSSAGGSAGKGGSSSGSAGTAGTAGAAATGGQGGSAVTPQFVGANGVAIRRVAIYQGPERRLFDNGQFINSDTPLIQGRPALIRVFYDTVEGYNGMPVTAKLNLAGGDPIVVEMPALGATSDDGALGSTINFEIPAERIGPSLDYNIEILQDTPGGTDYAGALFPSDRATLSVPVEGKVNTFRLMLVPFQYNADGSGRLPDTSPARVEEFRQRFMALYPVSNVEVQVREPEPWNQTISASGNDWQAVGQRLYSIRNNEKPGDDWYYYAIFNPKASFAQFCGSGCLLGVTLLNNQPSSTGEEGLRLAIGVGFDEYAVDTAAHEIGHSHGREHADCGPGLDQNSIDSNFPYNNGGIGVWGYDLGSKQLYSPNEYSDIMGYCETQFISDYNFTALSRRSQNVNEAKWFVPEGVEPAYDLVLVGADGSVTWGERLPASKPLTGTKVDVELELDTDVEVVTGQYFKYDHIGGGWLFLPTTMDAPVPHGATFSADGLTITATR